MNAMNKTALGITALDWTKAAGLFGLALNAGVLLLLLACVPQAQAAVTVSITAPPDNSVYTAPASITLDATASATQGFTVSKVEFFHGGTNLIGTDLTSPYSVNWTSVPVGTYTVTAKATAVKKNNPNQTATSAPITVIVNVANTPPTVSMTSPANNAVFAAPGSITLTATASDSDGTVSKVEFFHGGTNLIATVTTPPYTYNWTGVAVGSYSLTAKATDNNNGATTSSPVNVTVQVTSAAAGLYFIHTDHLNTPRLIANNQGATAWQWQNIDPFGNNAPNENPAGLGTLTCNLRLPGQYFDQETNLHYNYFRDYDPAIGRYIQSDPIGLEGGINTYLYVRGNPLRYTDPRGLTQQDIDNMLQLVDVTQSDLNVPSSVSTYEGGVSGGGVTWPVPGRPISISDSYLKQLNCDQLQQLFNVLTHESTHRTRPFSDMIRRPINHPDIYEDAARRTREARDLIRNYCKCP
jgi:RHS repeat-associated protein